MFGSYRYSARKPIFSSTLRFICVRRNRTSVHSARKHLPIPATYRNTLASIWALNRTVVRFANGNSRNYHICNSTFALIPAINRTSVVTLGVKKHSHNCRICNRIRDAIKPINRLNAIRATSVSAMNHLYSSTFQSIRIPST